MSQIRTQTILEVCNFMLGLTRKGKRKEGEKGLIHQDDQDSWDFREELIPIRYVRLPWCWDHSPMCQSYYFSLDSS